MPTLDTLARTLGGKVAQEPKSTRPLPKLTIGNVNPRKHWEKVLAGREYSDAAKRMAREALAALDRGRPEREPGSDDE